jgi:glycosyltransferase involved in cell wall biosynthesis
MYSATVERLEAVPGMSGTRVGLVCGYLDPSRDGVADYTRRLAVHLCRTGLEPLIVTTYEWARAAGEDAVGVTERWNIRGVASAARTIRRLDLDLVHVQFAPSVFGFSRAVGLLPRLLPRHIPLIVTLHEYGVWSGRGPGRRVRSALWTATERRGYADRETLLLAARAACLLVPSPEHLDVLRARFQCHAPAALEVPIGLNVEVATGDRAQARAEVRRELGAAPDAPLIVFFGFLHSAKALDQLITAMASVRAQLPGTQLLLIGGAVSHSVPSNAAYQLRRELERVAAAYGVQDQVHFTGYLPDAEVSRLLRAADVAAFPFRAGVTRKSSSLLTACAAGLPVVATAAPGQGPSPGESDGVFLVQQDETAALADALMRVLSDHALADRLTAAGRVRVASQSWDTIAAAHAEVYAQAVASHRGSASRTGTAEPSRVVPSTPAEGHADVTA